MKYNVTFRPIAQAEVRETFDWYEKQRIGLGDDFERAVEAAVEKLSENPASYQTVHGDTRRILLTRFPYGIFYIIEGTDVIILAVMHAKRDPRLWQDRHP
jgi:toxin ParE1/3/4